MYIRYRDMGSLDEILLRDVCFFRVDASGILTEDDGTEVQMYSIYDAAKTYNCDGEDDSFDELACFQSKDAALKVFQALCDTLEDGKNYFDLTKYDENGNRI